MAIWQYRHREKATAPVVELGTYHSWWSETSPIDGRLYGVLESERSECFDENHGWRFYKDPGLDNGGNLDVYRTTMKHVSGSTSIYRPAGGPPTKGLAFSGRVLASSPPTPSIASARDHANYQAPGLWNKARPAQPNFEGLNAFYELKDLPGMLRDRFRPIIDGFVPTAGKLFLAEQFGWKPLLRDVRDFYVAHLALKNSLEQVIRDEGKEVRRSARLKTNTFTNVGSVYQSYGAFSPTFVTQMYASQPEFFDTYTYTEDVWLKGAFKYWLPGSANRLDWKWRSWMLARMYGANPTPYRVYKAIPWTWLIDWFSNVGNVIGAMSSNVEERLAANYCYTMCHIKAESVRHSRGLFYSANNWDAITPISSSCTITREHKARIGAGIFGPTVSDDPLDLTGTQAAILGAIGVSRSRSPTFW